MVVVDVDSGSLQADIQLKFVNLVCVSSHMVLSLHSSNELWKWLCCDDSTMNIINVVVAARAHDHFVAIFVFTEFTAGLQGNHCMLSHW